MEKRHEEKTQDIRLLQDGGDEGATGAKREAAMHVHAHHQHIFFLCLVCDQLLREGLADRKTCCTQRASGYRRFEGRKQRWSTRGMMEIMENIQR